MRRLKIGLRLCLLAVLAAAWSHPVRAAPSPAATLTVNSTLDDTDANGNCTLREAVLAANTDSAIDACPAGSGADTIQLPAGTFILQIGGVDEDEALTGDLDVTGSLTILGAGPQATLIDANHLDRVFDVRAADDELRLEALSLANGVANCGGGIYNRGFLALTDVRMTENLAANSLPPACGDGGAVFSLGSIVAQRVDFDHNGAEERGGAIYAEGSLQLENCTLVENGAYDGGAIFLEGSGEITTSRVEYNLAMSGGGLFNIGDLTVTQTTFLYNRAQTDTGGGIRQLGQLTLRDGTLQANSAWQAGGGISAEAGVTQVENTLIAVNQAEDGAGGGVYQAGGDVQIVNSTLSGNQASLAGGGIGLTGGTAALIHSTLTQNAAGVYDPDLTSGGGGVAVAGGSLQLSATIVAGNEDRSPDLVHPDCSATPDAITSGGDNLVGQTDGCNWPAAAGDQLGSSDAPLDLLLGYLADWGGPTLIHGLLPGSPAIDAAGETLCPPTDQRGTARPQDGDGDGQSVCDSGAFEAGPVEGGPPPEPPEEIYLYLPLLIRDQ